MCPLKDAARDAPNLIAILSKDGSLTFAELDRYVDQIDSVPCIAPAAPSVQFIAQLFAAWRRASPFFPVNPRLPTPPRLVASPPPSSLLLLTSGSTAAPKTAILSFANLLANAAGAIQAVDLRPHDQWRLTLPLYHVGGIAIVIRCMLARATIVLDDSPNITHLSYVPTQLYRATPLYKHLRCLLVGGASVPSYPFPVSATYGLTEMASMVALNGNVLPDRELCLQEDGEIWVKGPSLFQGYLGHSPQNGWFATGDLGRYEKGRLIILGRKDWMFISGGENIQPEEVEKALLDLPGVVEAAVVAKKDPEFGARPAAFVKMNPKYTLNLTALSNTLPKYKIPVAVHIVDELPKKNDFKIDRFILSQIANS